MENEQLFASKYKLYLPTEEELREEIEAQKADFLFTAERNGKAKQGGKSSAPAKAVAFCSAKQGGKSSAPAKAVAFCSAKQGGLKCFHKRF